MSNFYSFQPVTMHRTIVVNLNRTQMGKVVVLCENSSHKIRGKFSLWDVPGWVNSLITELYLTAHINSLPEVPLPAFGEFESPTDKLNKTLQYEWGTARIEMELLLGDPQGNWASLGETALKNSNGYRYRRHRLLDLLTDNSGFQLEENHKLGVMLKNMGFGDIRDTDKLSITGSWTQEFVAVQQQPPYVVNNVYGGSGSTPTTANSNAVLTLTLASGTSAFIASGTPITVSLTKATASKTYTATWRKDGTLSTLTSTLTTDANGSATLSYDSNSFAVLGAGKYTLELTDNSKLIASNEINAVLPSITLTPASIYNLSNNSVSVAVTNIGINSTYTLEFVGVTGTSATRTQTAETTTFTFAGNLFPSAGTYKAKLTKGSITVESNTVTVLAAPALTLSTPRVDLAYFAEDTQVAFKATNLQKSASFTFAWIKNNVQQPSGTGTSDANGEWSGSFGCSVFLGSPYNGKGIYSLRVTQGTSIDITSSAIDIRALDFFTQPSVNQSYSQNSSVPFRLVGIPVGVVFTYTILKSGVAQGSAVNQTFVHSESTNTHFYFEIPTNTFINNYGNSTAYSIRISYNGKTLTSNTFAVQTYSDPGYGGALG